MTASPYPVSSLGSPVAALATGWGVRNVPGLAALLGCPVQSANLLGWYSKKEVVLAWGHRPSAGRAEIFAQRHGLPLWRLEDGFLRSVGLGHNDAPLSLVIDDSGIHYDATAPSRVEALIPRTLSASELDRARTLIQLWRTHRVSKYNSARDLVGPLPPRYVLVADQTWGDRSIAHGLADPTSFQVMLEAALAENPESTVLLKVHPQVFAGRRKGHFDLAALAALERVRVLGEDVHPADLIAGAEAVYAVTSQVGFEGLLWGKRVRTFGMPFYAGWGLTADALPAPDRRRPVALENLVHAALIDYARYLDPETSQRCEVERVVDWMGLQRRMRERFSAKLTAVGFSAWKKPIVRAFLAGSTVTFTDRTHPVNPDAPLILWGRKPAPRAWPREARIIRLEDGFIRSVGLGVDLVQPLSWVIDTRSVHYDPTRPSDLEHLLQTTDFVPALRERARILRERLVAGGLTKYNVAGRGWTRPEGKPRVILVPGQVETDASIRMATLKIRTNLALLQAVREKNPDAYIIYKPHPDVLAGLRKKGRDEDETKAWCDEWVTDVSMNDLLIAVDELHVLTSLAGFEALLRKKRVVCYGQPFYSGWGLTTDLEPISRRTRRLELDELVAATLILYPTYLSRFTGQFTTPERALEELLEWRQRDSPNLPLWRQGLRWFLRFRAH